MLSIVRISGEASLLRAGGRSIAGRIAEVLRRSGCEPIAVCADGLEARVTTALEDVPGPVPVLAAGSAALRARLDALWDETVVLVDANALYDERMLQLAAGWRSPAVLVDSRPGFDPATGLRAVRAAELAAGGLPSRAEAALPPVAEGVARVDVADQPTYDQTVRRDRVWYRVPVRDAADIGRARETLVHSVSKGHMEFLVHVLNRPAEVWLSRRLVELPITPNQITAFCNVLAFNVAVLFAGGFLWAGALLALAVGIADGLDGRQARVQVRTSRLGELEHLLDKVYETAWTAALAWLFYAEIGGVAWIAAGAWFAAYLADNLAYAFFRARTGILIDEASRFDAAVRFVASCRNTNVAILLVGLALGCPLEACGVVVVWGLVTASVHWLRVLLLLRPASGPRSSLT